MKMRISRTFRISLVSKVAASVIVICAMVSDGIAAEPNAKGIEFFEKKIRPVLVAQCYKCHANGAKNVRADLLLDSREGLLQGGESGEAVVPGKPGAGTLLSALRHEDFEMPPKKKLPASVIADFEKWIKMGAPDPRTSKTPVIARKTIDFGEARKFWAFQPPKQPNAPKVKDTRWSRSQADRHVLAGLEAAGLSPAADADPRVLVRRIFFDLVGLPPSPDEVEQFVEAAVADAQGATEKLVDKLLDSPQFGERWGRHWLDVAHYAESNGNVRNLTFPQAWRYRDYVIDAFNKDIPYDRFIAEQLAGDLLGGDTPAERNRLKIATGFTVLMSRPQAQSNPNYKMDLIGEQIEVTTKAFMGLTVACARCHDHKFDPIPTREYYAMAGIFTSSQMLYGGSGGNGMQAAGLHPLEGPNAVVAKTPPKQDDSQAKVAGLRTRQKEIALELRKLGGAKNRKKKGKAKPAGKAAKDSAQRFAALQREAKQVKAQLRKLAGNNKKRGRGAGPIKNGAMGVGEGSITNCRVNLRGEATKLGETVPRGFITVATIGKPPVIDPKQSGRLELARWLADPQHPLTARVMVNRIWQHLFGYGLVRTPDNFGLHGDRPSHPELLDHLALQFIADGWSVKQAIRSIMLTRTYAMSSQYDAKAYELDPDNRLLWRMNSRRLEGEALRDALLAVSGKLDRARPAGSVVSPHGAKIIRDNFTVAVFQVPSNHRSVYLPIVRNGIPEVLNLFDFADPSLVVGQRNVTTVPAQELFMINSPFVVTQSRSFAQNILAEKGMDDAARIDLAYRTAFSRPPTDTERNQVLHYFDETKKARAAEQKDEADGKLAKWAGFCQALLVSTEFRHLD